jgi:plasmid stabilization system protein ParE
MSYAVVVRPAAGRDIAEAYEHYSQHERDDAFMASIDHAFTQIVDRPMMYPVVYDEVRRALLRRFAYSVFFIVEPLTLSFSWCITNVAIRPCGQGRDRAELIRERCQNASGRLQ